jgi:phosphoglycerate kinase
MKLPDLRNFDLKEKRVLVRCDFDVPLSESDRKVADDTRIQTSLPTIQFLLNQNAKVILLAHLGRPEGQVNEEFSLKPVFEKLQELLPRTKINFQINELSNCELKTEDNEITLLENLRFNKGEEENSLEFAQKLASLGDFYINEAFAVSHREHASIVTLPRLLPHAAGFNFQKEITVLSSAFENPKRPVVVILGGVKEDKLKVIPGFLTWVDRILIGGYLPVLINKQPNLAIKDPKIEMGTLAENKLDLDLGTIERFSSVIQKAGTIIWAGPMGKIEDEEGQNSTRIIGQVIGSLNALRIAGGGDTEAALTKFNLLANMDYISTGGTAMLEFLANGDLPGLAALRE